MTMNFPVSLGMRRVLPAVALASAIAALTGCVVAPAYPVVPQGKARIRTQISAAHSRAELELAIQAFAEVKRELGV